MRSLAVAAIVLFATITLLWSAPRVDAEPQSLVVIAHPALKANTIHVSELRAVFLRQTEQIAGERVCPINHPAGNPLRLDFDAKVLGMNEDEVGRYWVDARIRGLGSPPRTIMLPQLIVRAVAALPGAIAYVPKSFLSGAKVKILHVDGLKNPL